MSDVENGAPNAPQDADTTAAPQVEAPSGAVADTDKGAHAARPVVGRLVPGETAGAAEPAILLRELQIAAVLEVGAWPNRLEPVANRLSELAGTILPGRPGRFSESDTALVGWVAFGRFIYIAASSEETARVDEALDTDDAAVVDLGPARRALHVGGSEASALLNKAVAIDFDPRAFPPGSLAQAVIHQIPVIILRRNEDGFDLLVPTSLADALIEWLTDAALEFGYRVAEPAAMM
jgi:heterotetrameric sarcosine oxidase gamma subunit